MRTPLAAAFCLCVGFASSLLPAHAAFRAGIAVRIVTPEPLLPVSGGIGPSNPVKEKRGEITVRAMVVEQDGTRIAFVSTDFLGFPSVLGDRVRAKVKGVPADHILIGATHTHSAPDAYCFPDGKGGTSGDLAYLGTVVDKAAAAIDEAVAKAKQVGSTVFLDAEAFAKAPAKSIDYAVMERTDKCWVVPARFRWSDLGTWDALLDVGEADSAGNVTEGPVEIDHVRNSYIRSDGPLTAVIGVEDVVVVSMNDAVLVGHRDNLPRLKDVVQRMSEDKHKAATEHAVMHRPWGSYHDIDRGERFRAKRLTVNPNGKLSLQSHRRRAEHWVVVKGVAEVTLDGRIMTLRENESIYIPIGGIHRLANPGKEPLEVVEVQTGDYLEEDDIIRYEDIYART